MIPIKKKKRETNKHNLFKLTSFDVRISLYISNFNKNAISETACVKSDFFLFNFFFKKIGFRILYNVQCKKKHEICSVT